MRRVVIEGGLQLQPVLEVVPWHFSQRECPPGPSRAHPGPWDEYFQACMRDAGFEGITTVGPGSFHVRCDLLVNHPILLELVHRDLLETGDPRLSR